MAKVCFPTDIARLIGEYAALWQFSQWVTVLGLENENISQYISQNPMAMDVIAHYKIDWWWFCKNPADWAVDLLLTNQDKISWVRIARNTNPRALALLESKQFSEEFMIKTRINAPLSTNPSALHLLNQYPGLIDISTVMQNTAAKELIERRQIPIDWVYLAVNHADWAVDLLLQSSALCDRLVRNVLSNNKNPRIVAYLIAHPEYIEWDIFSANPAAIDYLRANPKMIERSIYANPAALEPVILAGLVELLLEV